MSLLIARWNPRRDSPPIGLRTPGSTLCGVGTASSLGWPQGECGESSPSAWVDCFGTVGKGIVLAEPRWMTAGWCNRSRRSPRNGRPIPAPLTGTARHSKLNPHAKFRLHRTGRQAPVWPAKCPAFDRSSRLPHCRIRLAARRRDDGCCSAAGLGLLCAVPARDRAVASASCHGSVRTRSGRSASAFPGE